MNIVLVMLIIALIAKDTSYLGDPYIMRGISQGLCLIVGSLWLLSNLSSAMIQRYWPLLGYLIAIGFSVIGARDPIYVALQVLSISGVCLFFIAYFESRQLNPGINVPLLNTTIIAYSIVAMGSLIIALYLPSIAYETLYGGEIRFRGLFSKSGMLGSAGGLLVGISWYWLRQRWIKIIPLILGAICLVLPLSRTSWIAFIVASGLTTWLYYYKSRKWIIAVGGVGLILTITSLVFDISYSYDAKLAKKVLRTESMTSLSGRTELWGLAVKAFQERPVLGWGYTVGSEALGTQLFTSSGKVRSESQFNPKSSREISRATIHSGYLQSLLDVGLIGTFFYISVIIVAFRRFFVLDKTRQFPAEFYVLTFLVVGNIGQNVIYAASVFDSILFWAIATFALSLKDKQVIKWIDDKKP